MPQMAKQAIPFCLYAMAAWPNGVSEVFGRESNSSSIYSLPRSEPESKPEYETVVAGCFSQLTRRAGRVAILPAMGKPYVGSEFAGDLVAQTHAGIQV